MSTHQFNPNSNDPVVVVIGPTGSGRSNFINHLTGNAEQHGADSLKAHTQSVIPYPAMCNDRSLVLVDTPGLDDAIQPDAKTLRTIADQLERRYAVIGMLNVAGIVYLHNITDKRVSGSAGSVDKNLRKIAQLCGNVPLCRVRLVTTMWDKVTDRAVAESREKQLVEEYWQKLLSQGAVAKRFDNTRTCALGIVRELQDLGGHVFRLPDDEPSTSKFLCFSIR